MKVAVIDIGSNSVRLMMSQDGKTLYKKIQTTKLASKMKDGQLDIEAVERTVRAVSFFVNQARDLGVDEMLHKMGAKDGDTVKLCDFEFEYFE